MDRLSFVAGRKAAARRPELRVQIALARSGPARELPAVVRRGTHAIPAGAQMLAKPRADRLAAAFGAAVVDELAFAPQRVHARALRRELEHRRGKGPELLVDRAAHGAKVWAGANDTAILASNDDARTCGHSSTSSATSRDIRHLFIDGHGHSGCRTSAIAKI